MSSSELTLLDLKNLLECFELIPVDSKNDEKSNFINSGEFGIIH